MPSLRLRSLGALALLPALALATCTVAPPTGPTVVALPGPGKSFQQFQYDDQNCRNYAQSRNASAGQEAQGASNNSAVTAVAGTLLGAAAGAALGSLGGNVGAGAGIGAGVGLLGGASVAGGQAQGAADSLQGRYDVSYAQCMVGNGEVLQAPAGPPPGYYAPALATATELPAIYSAELTAHDRLAAPEPPPRRRLWPWALAALLHVLAVGLLVLLSLRHRPVEEALEPTGVSVVYDAGSSAQQAPRQAQETAPAQTPAAPPAPPPPQVAQTEPEVNLDMPDELMPPPQPAPPMPAPQSQPLAQPHARSAQRAARHSPRNYMVMNNMSFGNASPLSPTGRKGLNLSLPQSDAQAALAPEVTIQGDVGSDWNAGFNKWVYAHLYYPDAAAAQGQQGTVTVEFTAHRDGHVTGLRMTDSSGSTFLDQAWTGIFAQNLLPPFPPGGDDTVKITATVRYELEP